MFCAARRCRKEATRRRIQSSQQFTHNAAYRDCVSVYDAVSDAVLFLATHVGFYVLEICQHVASRRRSLREPRLQRASDVEVSDSRPGKSPTIRAERDTTTIIFVIGKQDGQQIELVLRCERSGSLYAAIALK